MSDYYTLRQQTFFILTLQELRGLLMWGYHLSYEDVEHVGASLSSGEYWVSIEADTLLQHPGGYSQQMAWDGLLEDLAGQGKIPPGDYLLSVYP